jgi:hypothetical protein
VGIFFFINAVVPLSFLLFFVRYKREASKTPPETWVRLTLVNIMGLFLFVGVAPSATYPRLCAVSLPALVTLVWLATRPGRLERTLLCGLWTGALVLAVALPLNTQIHSRAFLDLPTGRTAIREPLLYQMHRWVSEHTRPPEFLFEEDFPILNFALNLRNPTPLPFITNTDYTRPEQVSEVVQSLEAHRARFVIWSLWLDLPIDGRDWGDHLGPLRTYIRLHYHPVKSLGDYEEVWERNREGEESRATL